MKKIITNKNIGPVRWREMGRKIFISNDAGDFLYLSKDDFDKWVNGRLTKDSPAHKKLREGGFIIDKKLKDKLSLKLESKKSYIRQGPSLHIMVATLRCNHRCVYCHASAKDMGAKSFDMTRKTAKKALDKIFQTTSRFVVIEFQGGEPMANWPVVQYAVREARKRNQRAKKELEIRLVTNLSLMTDEKYKFLIDNDVAICTSFDGPRELHNRNRPMTGGDDGYKHVVKWIKRFAKDYPKLKKKGYIWKMSGIVVISRHSLKYPEKIVDEYLKSGFKSLFLRPLNPFGFGHEAWDKINYSAKDFIRFYKKALDHIIDLNLKGIYFEEKLALTFLVKIMTEYDPNMMEIRNPCGAGIGQLAYNYNGDVYTCDEGRMMSMMGDENFKIGNVHENEYEEIVTHPTTRTLCSASCLEALPYCSDCAYLPYCGVCPIYNYFAEGNIFSQMPANARCRINMAILDHLFKKLKNKKVKAVFESWLKNFH